MLFTEMKTRSTELNKCVHHGYIVGKILIYPRSTDNVFCAIDKEGTDLKKFFRRYTGLLGCLYIGISRDVQGRDC